MGKLKEEEIMCKIISVVNQKGGVGKTTTTVNVGIGLAREGKKRKMGIHSFLWRNVSRNSSGGMNQKQ